jgi:predicted Na+-dependent transporter
MDNDGVLMHVTSLTLLFCLVFGMSATVDIHALKAQVNNVKAIATTLLFQFLVLPLVGFVCIKAFALD